MNSHILSYNDIKYKFRIAVTNWIYKKCNEIAKSKKMYPDMSQFECRINLKHFNNLKEVRIDLGLNDTIIIMFYYKNEKFHRVYFIDLTNEMSYHDYIVNKIKNIKN